MSTALFYMNPKPSNPDPALTRKSNHLLARVFGDGVISRESFKFSSTSLPEDTETMKSKRQKYKHEIPVLDGNSLEPKLIHAPVDKLADNPNVDDLVLSDLKEMENIQRGVMASLLIAGSAVIAWLITSKFRSGNSNSTRR